MKTLRTFLAGVAAVLALLAVLGVFVAPFALSAPWWSGIPDLTAYECAAMGLVGLTGTVIVILIAVAVTQAIYEIGKEAQEFFRHHPPYYP